VFLKDHPPTSCVRDVLAELARFAAYHQPFYDQLYAQRLDVTPWEHAQNP